jgi:hypothetical protein
LSSGQSRFSGTVAGFTLAAALILLQSPVSADEGRDPGKIDGEELTALVDLDGREVHYGGMMISAGESVTGPVLVIKGSLDIQDGGVLNGDAWVINGDLILTGAAAVKGRVFIVNGSGFMSHDARIAGGIAYYRCECALDDAVYEDSGDVVFVRKEDPRAVRFKAALKPGRPSRVDYEILRLGVTRENDRHRDPYTKVHAFISVPIWKDTGGFLGFDAGVSIPLGSETLRLELGAFKRTESNDTWQIGRLENGFILMNTGDDFLDYWERRGAEAGLSWQVSEYAALEGFVSYQEDVSLAAMRLPSILRSTRRYRENPAIDDGERLALRVGFRYDGREDESWRRSAWRLDAGFEKGFRAGDANFSYEAFYVELARYQYAGRSSRVDLRGRVFSAFSPLPGQMKRTLSGYAGVRGARDMPFPVEKGDRLLLFSVEARRRLPDLKWVRSLFTYWDLLAFSDIGLLAEAEDKESPFGFLDTPFENWIKTAGLGLSGQSFLPHVGLYVAQDLDRDRFDPRVILRFDKSF